jgi:hypothetical protein
MPDLRRMIAPGAGIVAGANPRIPAGPKTNNFTHLDMTSARRRPGC